MSCLFEISPVSFLISGIVIVDLLINELPNKIIAKELLLSMSEKKLLQ